MNVTRAIVVALGFAVLLAGHTHAAGAKHWSDTRLHLALAYPGDWRMVRERGAALKLLAPDAAGEFEIFSLPAPLSQGGLAAQAEATLVKLHCATAISHTSGMVGHLGVGGRTATGACTGGDRGWQLTVTAFDYRQQSVLVRSWLFHRRQRDGAALGAIAASLMAGS